MLYRCQWILYLISDEWAICLIRLLAKDCNVVICSKLSVFFSPNNLIRDTHMHTLIATGIYWIAVFRFAALIYQCVSTTWDFNVPSSNWNFMMFWVLHDIVHVCIGPQKVNYSHAWMRCYIIEEHTCGPCLAIINPCNKAYSISII